MKKNSFLALKLTFFFVIALLVLEIRSNVMLFTGKSVYGQKESDSSRDHSFTDNTHVTFHPHFGYLYRKEKFRFLRIYNNEVVFDSIISPNAQGLLSHQDFTHKKEKGVFRIMVLGDSYSAGSYLSHPWATTAEKALNKSERKYEIYNFAVDGAGTANWHDIFFEEILPHYEFDALVLATAGWSFQSSYFFEHGKEDGNYMLFSDDKPKDENDFLNNFLPRMKKSCALATEEEINSYVQKTSLFEWNPKPLQLLMSAFLMEKFENYSARIKGRLIKSSAPVTREVAFSQETNLPSASTNFREYFTGLYPKRGENVLKILDYAKAKHIPLLITPTPERETWKTGRLRKIEMGPQTLLKDLAKEVGADYFDGYQAIEGQDIDSLASKYWLKYDGHWNQAGSDLYAEKIAKHIQSHWGLDKGNL